MRTFVDLFSGIGGIRSAFEKVGAECVFSSERDRFAQQTYAANFGETPAGDIRVLDAADIPDHDVLLAGFPCQPFSIAGVSKKNSLGQAHGFADRQQGNLFFEIARILEEKQPPALLLENVRNLQTHDRGRTFRIIQDELRRLGYRTWHQVLDARGHVPQQRKRIFIVGFHQDVWPDLSFTFPPPPAHGPYIGDILEEEVAERYTLSDHLWGYLQAYAEKHRRRGNGFGYGLVDPQRDRITRTLSARYYKDGSEILIRQAGRNPRRLTPRECARLMGFPDDFVIPVSDTQAYRQFGNSVVVPLVEEVARTMLGWQNSVKALSAIADSIVAPMQSITAMVEQMALYEKQTNEALLAAVQTPLAALRSVIDAALHDVDNQLDLVVGNLAEMSQSSPQPFSALELSDLFVHKAGRFDPASLNTDIFTSALNGASGAQDKGKEKSNCTLAGHPNGAEESVTVV